jgi:DNA-binding transcriptional LysR family regulator
VASGDHDFTLLQIRYFVTAAEHRSMTAAASELMVSQSAVSSAIAQLERSLRLQLFLRHHARGLSLTPAGTRFLSEARALLRHAADVADAALGLSGELTGRLTVGCFTTLSPFYVPRLLGELSRRHPGLHVDLVEGQTDEVLDALTAGRCELALAYELGLPDTVEREVLLEVPPHVIVSARHRLARRKRGVRLEALADEPLVLLDLPHSREYFRSLLTLSGVDPQVRYRSPNYETVRALVASGQGFSILNQQPASAQTYDGGTVVALPLLDNVPGLPLMLIRVRGVRLTRRAEAFAALCRELVPARLRARGPSRTAST